MMLDTVARINPPASDEIIKVLEELLDEARQGNIRAIAIAFLTTDRTADSVTVTGDSWAALLGSVAAMQHDIITSPNT